MSKLFLLIALLSSYVSAQQIQYRDITPRPASISCTTMPLSAKNIYPKPWAPGRFHRLR